MSKPKLAWRSVMDDASEKLPQGGPPDTQLNRLPPYPDSHEIVALRAIVEGTARTTGEEFFQTLVRHLAAATGVRYAFVAQFAEVNTRARTLAFWTRDRFHENLEWELAGTPCEDVVRGGLCFHPTGVSQKFPNDEPMVALGIESYLGVPLLDANGNVLGHLAVFDDRPMDAEPRRLFTFKIFAARAAAELERFHAERMLHDSERRYRDLYEEAPIAYLSIGIDGRILTGNQRATEWLGYSASEFVGLSVAELFPVDPERKGMAEECFHKFMNGEEVAGTELELRRRDGRPLWISLWTKPFRGPDGRVQAGRSIWVDITDRVLAEAKRVRLERHNLYLQEEIRSLHNFVELVGNSAGLKGVLDKISQVAPIDATVLITGETGTGKELVARAIHKGSARKEHPLVRVDCAAITAGLVESELFGHVKGAFTGAIGRRIGRFELADGGTIFLDEVGELPLDTQAKLLGILQEQQFEPVGSSQTRRVDVRVIAATNRNLEEAVRAGRFRSDLFYRLNVFPIEVPPLRERKSDIPQLALFFVSGFAKKFGKTVEAVSRETMDCLTRYAWPGNVRELQNVIERAVVLSAGPTLELGPEVLPSAAPLAEEGTRGRPVPASPISPAPASVGLDAALKDVERSHILSALKQAGWVIEGARGAAKTLKLHPNTLRSRIEKLG
ncbi:MAG: sigma 54-interacting transcriptional regulator, partial [bacterium]